MPSSTAREPLSLAEPTPPRPDDSIALILDLADQLRRESIERGRRPVGLGVVVPGQGRCGSGGGRLLGEPGVA
ncbi:hypothetical protein [Calidifontibacter indicus]|uniref:hypothetical protein n=1 Tax=Calidifontibacter indicus TaxID=419650 RepID=UPI0014746346|nr:hypothetical protein [Calidifontibacter indicus]